MKLIGQSSMSDKDSVRLYTNTRTDLPVIEFGEPLTIQGDTIFLSSFPIFLSPGGLDRLEQAIKEYRAERGRQVAIATAREVAGAVEHGDVPIGSGAFACKCGTHNCQEAVNAL